MMINDLIFHILYITVSEFYKLTWLINSGAKMERWSVRSSCLTGNELSGNGVGTRVGAAQYADDVISLKSIIREIYKDLKPRPLVLAPGGFFDSKWFGELMHRTLPDSFNVITHHIYNLGPGAKLCS